MPNDRRQQREPPAVAVARQHRRDRVQHEQAERDRRDRVRAQRHPVAVDDARRGSARACAPPLPPPAARGDVANRVARRLGIANASAAPRPASARRTAASSPRARPSRPAGASVVGRAASARRLPHRSGNLERDKRARLAQSRRPHASTHWTCSTRFTTCRGSCGSAASPLIAAIIFAETGLLVGFFLPGDSLLVTAGIYCTSANPDQAPLLEHRLRSTSSSSPRRSSATRSATGSAPRPGRRSSRARSRCSSRRSTCCAPRSSTNATAARRSSSPASCPIIRTFAPVVAGVGKMSYRRFISFNVFGGIGWVAQHDAARLHAGQDLPADHQADRQGHHRHHLRLARCPMVIS